MNLKRYIPNYDYHKERFSINYKHLDKTLLKVLYVAIGVIFVTEFLSHLSRTYYPNLYKLQSIIQKLSYSYVSAFVFYILAVFLPKQRRKAKLTLLVNNTCTHLAIETKFFYRTLLKFCDIKDEDAFSKNFAEIFDNTSAIKVFTAHEGGVYSNWNHYVQQKLENMDRLIHTLIPLYDILPPDTLRVLSYLIHDVETYRTMKLANDTLNPIILLFPEMCHFGEILPTTIHSIRDYKLQNSTDYRRFQNMPSKFSRYYSKPS